MKKITLLALAGMLAFAPVSSTFAQAKEKAKKENCKNCTDKKCKEECKSHGNKGCCKKQS